MRTLVQKVTLYLSVVTLLSSAPMSAFAVEQSAPVTEKPKRTYHYDPAIGRWNSDIWTYDKATNQYIPTPKPSPAVTEQNTAQASPTSTVAPTGGAAVVDQTVEAASDTNIENEVGIGNSDISNAKTGDAAVSSNTRAGDAKTGDALASTTIINSVHSTVGGDNAGVAEFVIDVHGDIVGDITIGPSIDGIAAVHRDVDLSSEMNVDNDVALTNDVTISAASGDATVNRNTQAGSATSGNADAVASVLNLINTIIAANKSFIGTINIWGNLNGDILVSPEFIPQLIASNSDIVSTVEMPLTINTNNDQSIVNNVNLGATTGTATVANNTTAGNARTGEATTNLTILNLTGHEVNAANSLLVFVNVLGEWVGIIVDAPGATAAALGNGVINTSTNISAAANIDNSAAITNNIDLSAVSGDASVTENTLAGDATTGNATASANIANISTSKFDLTDWFGILFINVFGKWVGSFGVDTKAGTVTPLVGGPKNSGHPNAPDIKFGFNPGTPTHDSLAAALFAAAADTAQRDNDRGGAAVSSTGTAANGSSGIASEPSRGLVPNIATIAGLISIVGAYVLLWAVSRWTKAKAPIS